VPAYINDNEIAICGSYNNLLNLYMKYGVIFWFLSVMKIPMTYHEVKLRISFLLTIVYTYYELIFK
jgi:hypothetical protein